MWTSSLTSLDIMVKPGIIPRMLRLELAASAPLPLSLLYSAEYKENVPVGMGLCVRAELLDEFASNTQHLTMFLLLFIWIYKIGSAGI